MCPINSVESEIVSQLRICAGFEEQRDQVRVTEDRGEDEWRLSAAGAFVDISSVSDDSTDSACVARGYCLG